MGTSSDCGHRVQLLQNCKIKGTYPVLTDYLCSSSILDLIRYNDRFHPNTFLLVFLIDFASYHGLETQYGISFPVTALLQYR